MSKRFLLVVVGPTAVGKTGICINLAEYFHTEIVSADSRQFYKEMNHGTAKPSFEEQTKIQHHLIDHLSIHDAYTVKDFETDALGKISDLHSRKETAILAGGSGLYVQALCNGLDDMPTIPKDVRAAIMLDLETKGLPFLLKKLEEMDPHYFSIVDKANPQRIVRALEVSLYTKKPYSTFRKRRKVKRSFNIINIGLNREREDLYDRIDRRMDQMIENGLFDEAKSLFPFRKLNALQTVGYSEIFRFLEGEYDYEEAVRLLKRNSRRYAKRQMTWFNKDESIKWFDPENIETIKNYIDKRILHD